MDEEGKTLEEEQKQEEADAQSRAVTRRQFLVGAGAGLVVGAAGAAGVVSLVAPKPAAPQAQAVQPQTSTAPPAQVASALPPNMRQVTLNIDGKDYDVTIDVRMSLWEVLTYHLGMSNSNQGCDRSQCGACAVVIDGRAVNSCNMLAARLGRGQKIVTVDSLNKGTHPEDLHPIQTAFQQEGAFQCGLCTRGMIMSTYALLTKNPNPTEDEVREALSGNICRCSSYPKVYEAVFRAANDMRKKA